MLHYVRQKTSVRRYLKLPELTLICSRDTKMCRAPGSSLLPVEEQSVPDTRCKSLFRAGAGRCCWSSMHSGTYCKAMRCTRMLKV
ncbi:hypothetical protein BAUCODRAFT_450981 [Baudoinia panamericana UAMH 10762]|uniref:Uncharacterized protein n=1 Tax=Baudoinia panamericana (strain UAMH 10762) TaxID=717646 RepID=M2LSE5_BAUPA|nr:uncharacterized protein BAUCODRAFT_450981 [Baudoinia panamericana UAMH 10762]EMC97397.1 hypothetical protein BAUCODRAFT_450981 [Baudoinia panamericana UAMH 10762]